GLAIEIVSVDDDPSGRRLQQAGDHADAGRLAGAVRSEEAVDLSRRDADRHVVNRRERAVALDDVFDGDHREPPAHGEAQHPHAWRRGRSIASGRASSTFRPTRIGVEFGVTSTLVTNILTVPIIGRIAACFSRPPRASRRCVASAGNWLSVGSTGSQTPGSTYTSGHAW